MLEGNMWSNMQPFLVSVFLAICSAAIVSASDTHYVITVPGELEENSQQKVCVNIQDLNGKLHLKMELHKNDEVYPVIEDQIDAHDYSHCYSFQVPAAKRVQTEREWVFHVSGHGEHLNINESKRIFVEKKKKDICVIQTDKYAYKPGDTVRFLALSIDNQLRAVNTKYDVVVLEDPNGFRIAQWLDVTPNHGFADFTFHLGKHIQHGQYSINIPERCDKHSFFVHEYVPQRFEVLLKLPEDVKLCDKSFTLQVCGKYTYGKPVMGDIEVEIYPRIGYDYISAMFGNFTVNYDILDMACTNIKGKTDSNGCLSKEINLPVFNSSDNYYLEEIGIIASLTEDFTGQKEKEFESLHFSDSYSIQFVNTARVYHKGYPFTGTLKVTNKKMHPVANVDIKIGLYGNAYVKEKSDENGLAYFSLNTNSWENTAFLTARIMGSDKDDGLYDPFRPVSASAWIDPLYSESNSFVDVESISNNLQCESDLTLKVKYKINKDQLDPHTDHISFLYLVKYRDGIHSHNEYQVNLTDQSSGSYHQGSFPVKMHLPAELSPFISLVVYALLSKGETVAGSATYNIGPCLKNKVQLKYSEEQVHPEGEVKLDVSADPGSLCHVRALDKGFLLQHPYYKHSLATAIADIVERHSGLGLGIVDPFPCPGWTRDLDSSQIDPSVVFQAVSIQVFSNTRIKKSVICSEEEGIRARASSLKRKEKKGKEEAIRKTITRTLFSDSWINQIVTVGQEGHVVLNLSAPHSITKWETDAFCLSDSGIGEIKNVGLTVFLNYFIELIVPPFVVQEEKFKIQAVVFSYEPKCILVGVALYHDDGIKIAGSEQQARCVCSGQSHYFSWNAKAIESHESKIRVDSGSLEIEGECKEDSLIVLKEHREDSVEKIIQITPRGFKGVITETHLLNPSENTQKATFTLKTPDRMISGSERAHIIVQGDLLANTIANIDDLLGLPDACAEQTLSKFSRYIATLEYLKSINKITPEHQDKFLKVMIEAYQKVLSFKKDDGSYGFFDFADSNLWITVLALNALNGAQTFFYIDDKVLDDTLKWVENAQLPEGNFKQRGPYFNNRMDADNDLASTAYVVIALLENPLNHSKTIVEKALAYIRKEKENADSTSTIAFLAYAFTLAGDIENRALMLKHLNEKATTKDGYKYWKSAYDDGGEVVIAAYVLMALCHGENLSQEELTQCADIARWLVTQQNSQGGFQSSQDSTVCLHALAKYARVTSYKIGNATIIIEDESGFHKEVHVSESNSLLLQTVDLPKVPGVYTASLKGDGFAYVQSHIHYYSIPDSSDNHFAINVSTNPSVCSHAAQTKFEVKIDTSYIGKLPNTNMVILKVDILSGFVLDEDSIKKLKKDYNVDYVDMTPGKAELYISMLNHEMSTFSFVIKQDMHVDNLQPANIIMYDYYNPEMNIRSQYHSPCFAAHCVVHASERLDCGYHGITKEQCEQNNCCFDSNTHNTKWCFFHGYKPEDVQDSSESQESH